MTKKPLRPLKSDPSVRERVCRDFLPRILEWVKDKKIPHYQDKDEEELTSEILLAVQQSPDHLQAIRYVDSFYQWPVDVDLLDMFTSMYRRIPQYLKDMEIEWVMETGTRIIAKEGERVTFSLGGKSYTGTVMGVIASQAKAYVKIGSNDSVKYIPINAEEIEKTLPRLSKDN